MELRMAPLVFTVAMAIFATNPASGTISSRRTESARATPTGSGRKACASRAGRCIPRGSHPIV